MLAFNTTEDFKQNTNTNNLNSASPLFT